MGTRSSRGGSRAGRAGGPIRPAFEEGSGWGEKPDHKTAALCKQVQRALAMSLAGECADPVLQGLLVESVMPAPHAGHLLVRVLSREGGPAEVLPRLEAVTGMLRRSIAEAICRKRTPQLSFEVVPLRALAKEVERG